MNRVSPVSVPGLWTYHFFPIFRVCLLAILTTLMGSLTACSSGLWLSPQDSSHEEQPDPYVQFTQAVAAVEPLVSPELEALAQSQRDALGRTSTIQGGVSLPKVVPLKVNGDLAIATSPKLLPLNEQMYKRFVQGGYRGIMDIKVISSSKAIRQFCQQQTLGILTISRPMTEAEMTYCQTQKRSPVGLAFGQDALVVVVNQQNDFIRGVTLDHLGAILTQNNWSAIQSNWPQRPIIRSLMGPDSATVSLLSSTLFNGTNAIAQTPNTQYFDAAEPMLQALRTMPDGVAILSYATFKRSPSVFKSIPINGITASPDTIRQGDYPLTQMLYLYVDQQQLNGKSPDGKALPTPVTDWVNFYLTNMHDVMAEVFLLSLNRPQLKALVDQWSAMSQH